MLQTIKLLTVCVVGFVKDRCDYPQIPSRFLHITQIVALPIFQFLLTRKIRISRLIKVLIERAWALLNWQVETQLHVNAMEELHMKLWISSSGVCRRVIKPIRLFSYIRRLKIKEKRSFASSGTAHPPIKCHIPEVRTFQPYCYESIKTFAFPFTLNTIVHYVLIAEGGGVA